MNYWKGWDNMASKKSLLEKAGGDMAKFFTGSETKADQQEDTRKPLNDTEKAVLEKYNAGMTVQKEIAEAIGKDPAGVNRALKRIREEYPELLQEPDTVSGSDTKEAAKQPEKPAEATKPAETIESKPEPEKPQETAQEQPQKPEKNYIKFNLGQYTDYVKTMAGFRQTNVTNYIQDLIAEDMEKNAEIYEKLKNM